MFKKKINIVLVSALIVVWGIIMYKLFWPAGADEEIADFTPPTATTGEVEVPDSIVLALDYRDPFLGKQKRPKRNHSSSSSGSNSNRGNSAQTRVKQPVKTVVPDAVSLWPQVVYVGMIKNAESSEQVAIVHVNNQSFQMAVGDSASGVVLGSMSSDSILVEWQSNKKVVKLVP